jgi:peptide/nickel transport system substrate-binding protein
MRKRLLGMLAVTAVVVAACGGAATPSPSAAPSEAPPSEAPSAEPSPTPEVPDLFGTTYGERRSEGTAGGQVIIADWQEATLWQPYYQGQVTEADVTAATWASTVTQTDDFRYAADLAVEIPTIFNGGVTVGEGGDAMTVTWKLKPGLKWSDGTPLTCADYEYTHNWIMDPDNTGLYGGVSGYEDVTKFECADDTTMVLHFGKIYEGYICMYACNGGVPLQQAYFSKFPVADQVNGAGMAASDMPNVPVSGPYKFESITPGAELRLVRNDNYTSPWSGQPANLDRLIFKWYGDADVMIAGYRAGEFDVAKDLNDGDLPKVEDLGDQVVQLTALTYEFLRPQWNPEVCSINPAVADRGTGCPVSDAAVREAVRLAVNKQEINDRLLGGNAALGYTNVSPNAWYYSPPPEYGWDLEAAKAALEAAGWVAGADGVREKDGLKAKIELCTTTRQVRQDTLALIAAWLKEIGIEAIPNAVSPADIFASYNEATDQTPCNLSYHHFDIAEHAFSVPLDPVSNYGVYESTQEAPNGQNDATINDPDVDRIMNGVKNTVDFAEIKSLFEEWQQIYVERTIEIPLYFRKEVYLKVPALQNFTGNPTQQGPTWNVADWYLSQ